MKLNKTVAKTMVFALGLGAFSLLGGYTAKATTATVPDLSKLTLDTGIESFKIGTSSNINYWGVAKEARSEKSANLVIGDAKYTVTDVNPVVDNIIDLSSFPKTKKLMIAVGTSEKVGNTDWKVQTLDAASKDFVVEYLSVDATNGKKVKNITAADNKLGKAEVGFLVAANSKEGTALDLTDEDVIDNIEVQQGDGAWAALETVFGGKTSEKVAEKLPTYVATGKTLKFRLKTANKWNTNVSVLKINPLQKAPAVKFDVVKGVTNLKKGMEVKVAVKDASGTASYADATDKMDFTALSVYGAAGFESKGGTITVRTKATDKKLASKEVVYTIEKQAAPTVTATDNVSKNDGVISNEVSVALKVLYDVKKGAVLTNKSDKDYEYFVSYTGANPDKNTKWKKLAKQKTKGKTTKPTDVSLKYSATEKVDAYGGDATKIFLRLAGQKQVGNHVVLASPFAGEKLKFGKIAQTFIPSGTGTTNATTAITVKKATAGTYKIDFALTNLQKKKSSPKLKITKKVNGVSLKADKFVTATGNDKSSVTLKFSKSAFKTAGNHSLVFTISAEGATHDQTVNINVTD